MAEDAVHKSNLREVEKTFRELLRSRSKLLAACTTDEQRDLVVDQYVEARDAYFKALEARLIHNNAVVEQLRRELKTANITMKAALKKVTDVVAAIDVVTAAVRLAASLVTLAAA